MKYQSAVDEARAFRLAEEKSAEIPDEETRKAAYMLIESSPANQSDSVRVVDDEFIRWAKRFAMYWLVEHSK